MKKVPLKQSAPSDEPVALSVRQPWATLLVHGIKTIEVRSWSTKRTGSVYIHAGKQPDSRDDAWRFLPPHLIEQTELRGGIVGKAILTGCTRYNDKEQFARDVGQHFNNPDWFDRRLFGFVFEQARPHPFIACKGGLYFFQLPTDIATLV